jgi:four helix bundle protein
MEGRGLPTQSYDRSEQLRKRTKQFAIRITKMYDSLPHRPSAFVLGKQLLRSGTSVGANYRAACRARSKAEFIARIGVVSEEADECVYWLELLIDAEIVPSQRLDELLQESRELSAIFTASYDTARGK